MWDPLQHGGPAGASPCHLATTEVTPAGIEDGEKDIIITAVLCHNMLDLPDSLQEPGLLFAKMIRDADKLDILEVFTGHFARPDSDLARLSRRRPCPRPPDTRRCWPKAC